MQNIEHFISNTFIDEQGQFIQVQLNKRQYVMLLKAALQAEDEKLQLFCKKALYYAYSDVQFMLKYLPVVPIDKSIKLWHYILVYFKKQDIKTIVKFIQNDFKSSLFVFHTLKEPYITIMSHFIIKACEYPPFKDFVCSVIIKSSDYRYTRLLIALNYNKTIPNNCLSECFVSKYHTYLVHLEMNFNKGKVLYKSNYPSLRTQLGSFTESTIMLLQRQPRTKLEHYLFICDILFFLKMSTKDIALQATNQLSKDIKALCKSTYHYESTLVPIEGKTTQLSFGFQFYSQLPTQGIMKTIKRFKLDIQHKLLTEQEKLAIRELINEL